jgi:hypothetical protein
MWQERTKIFFTIAILGILMYIWYNKNVLVWYGISNPFSSIRWFISHFQ